MLHVPLLLAFFVPLQEETAAPRRLWSDRAGADLSLPKEEEAFVFGVFGDRTGGPPEGILILEEAVADVNLFEPDLVMTVGDLVQGYGETHQWLEQMREFRAVMDGLACAWFPVAGNHDVYWRGPQGQAPPPGEHESDYEAHFGPLWYAFPHKNAWFIVLYTDEGDPATGRKDYRDPACQTMSPAQFAWLEATLARAKNAAHVFVFLHHPRWLEQYGEDWERVHHLLVAAGNVSAVFAGHIHHMRYDGPRDGIEYLTLATVGGAQVGDIAAAGFLHEYHLVTVRPDHIAVATLPVGAVLDPRALSGELVEEVAALGRDFRPTFGRVFALGPEGDVAADVEVSFVNPSVHPLALDVRLDARDGRFRATPDHEHVTLEPGATTTRRLGLSRAAAPLDAAFALPELVVGVEVLLADGRLALPERRTELPFELSAFPALPRPASERVLFLDGRDDAAALALDVPDGPLTLECWLRAEAFASRQGVVTKTENSEFGLFAPDGRLEWYVHLDGTYAIAGTTEPVLTPGTWHHVAGVFDGREARLYVDGEPVATLACAGVRTKNALPLLVGADVSGSGGVSSPLAGELDELRLTTRAVYLAPFRPARRLEADADTLVLLHMDGAAGPWIRDASGGERHPTLRGGASIRPARLDGERAADVDGR